MAKEEIKINLSPGLPVLLFLVFLVLKLTGVIAWSWWWITAPLWFPAIVLLFGLGLVLVLTAVGLGLSERERRRLGFSPRRPGRSRR